MAKTGALGLPIKEDDSSEFLRYPKRLTFAETYNINTLACGFGFTAFGLDTEDENKLYGTGLNTESQLGYHQLRNKKFLELLLLPQPIKLPLRNLKTRVKQLSAGRAHLLVLTDEGIFTLGSNAYGQCGRDIIPNEKYSESTYIHNIERINGEEIITIVAGQDHSYVT